VPFGVPRPVGPSKPGTAVQRYFVEVLRLFVQLPFEPLVTSLSAPGSAPYGSCAA
jgi:hypothetical protein